MIDEFANWRWPLRPWAGYRPIVSDTYSAVKTSRHREHHGVDIMFKRRPGGPDAQFRAGSHEGSPGFFCPSGTLVVAPLPGKLWATGHSELGHHVILDCGAPLALFFQHMSALLVQLGVRAGKGKIPIAQGQPLGFVGHSLRDGERLDHLHFEVWRNGGAGAHVDPAPYLGAAAHW